MTSTATHAIDLPMSIIIYNLNDSSLAGKINSFKQAKSQSHNKAKSAILSTAEIVALAQFNIKLKRLARPLLRLSALFQSQEINRLFSSL